MAYEPKLKKKYQNQHNKYTIKLLVLGIKIKNMTITEKILAGHSDQKTVKPGDIIDVEN
ncbi:MAG: hypothetical protein U9N85_00780 [Bacteroidota bacterium]|nr:hypothetical protein [Bacteroidota bacterium]